MSASIEQIIEEICDQRIKSAVARLENLRPFELFRLSNSKKVVDISTNTLRDYNKRGLPFYRQGKAVFVSKTELIDFIKRTAK